MVGSWTIHGKAKCRWVLPQQVIVCHAGGTISGLCLSGAPPLPRASAIRAALLFGGAALRPDKEPQDRGTLTSARQTNRLIHT